MSPDAASWIVLQRRLSLLRDKEVARDRQLARNWRAGVYKSGVVASVPHGDFVRKLRVQGDLLLCGTARGSVCLSDLQTGLRVTAPNAHVGQVSALDFDGSFIATAGADKTVLVWDLSRTEFQKRSFWSKQLDDDDTAFPDPLFRLQGHSDLVTSIILDANGKRIITASADGTVQFWDLRSGEAQALIRVGEPVLCMVETASNYLLVGCASGRVQAYQGQGGLYLLSILCHDANTTAVAFHENSQILVTGDAAGHVKLWNLNSGASIGSLPSHSGAVMSLQVDGTKIVSSSRDGSIAVSTVNSLERQYTIYGFTKFLGSAVFTDTRLIADGTNNVIVSHQFDGETG